jgi:hypothetical protein
MARRRLTLLLRLFAIASNVLLSISRLQSSFVAGAALPGLVPRFSFLGATDRGTHASCACRTAPTTRSAHRLDTHRTPIKQLEAEHDKRRSSSGRSPGWRRRPSARLGLRFRRYDCGARRNGVARRHPTLRGFWSRYLRRAEGSTSLGRRDPEADGALRISTSTAAGSPLPPGSTDRAWTKPGAVPQRPAAPFLRQPMSDSGSRVRISRTRGSAATLRTPADAPGWRTALPLRETVGLRADLPPCGRILMSDAPIFG